MTKNKIYNFIFFVLIFIIMLCIFVLKPVQDLDELWNYNIAKCMADGLVPYRDISMITSPLLSMITAVFLKIVANELIITRILGAVLSLAVIYSFHRTMKLLKVNDLINYIITLIVFYEMKNYICLDYNWAVILMGIITFNFELKNSENKDSYNFKNDLITGILIGIAICFKQSIGSMFALASIIYKLAFIHKKENINDVLKSIFTRILGIIIPIYSLAIYLILNNALFDYIDYCYFGILTFSNSISYAILLEEGSNIIIKTSAIAIPILFIVLGIKIIINLIKQKDIKKPLLFLCYSISMFMLTFPIANANHFFPGAFVGIAILTYYLDLILKKLVEKCNIKENRVLSISTYIVFIILLVVSLINIFKQKNTELKQYIWLNDLKHFNYTPMDKGLHNAILDVDEFLLKLNSKVYILDSDAVIYMIPLDRYNKDYDMFNVGNFGSKGEQGKIQDLNKEKDLTVLIKKDNSGRNWQNPELVRKYIKNNFEKIDEVFVFDVYKK